MIVGPHPLRGGALHLVQIVPMILGQPFVARGPVEPFDVGILLWLARLDIVEPYAHALAHSTIAALRYSGPLSHRIAKGFPRQPMISLIVRITCSDGSEKSTSMPSPYTRRAMSGPGSLQPHSLPIAPLKCRQRRLNTSGSLSNVGR